MLANHVHPDRHHASADLHPAIFRIIIASIVAWLLITLSFFQTGGYGMVALVAAVFAVVVVTIPARIAQLQHMYALRPREKRQEKGSLFYWLSGDFEIWDGQTTGFDAAVSILLPSAAAVLGGIGIAIVFGLVS